MDEYVGDGGCITGVGVSSEASIAGEGAAGEGVARAKRKGAGAGAGAGRRVAEVRRNGAGAGAVVGGGGGAAAPTAVKLPTASTRIKQCKENIDSMEAAIFMLVKKYS